MEGVPLHLKEEYAQLDSYRDWYHTSNSILPNSVYCLCIFGAAMEVFLCKVQSSANDSDGWNETSPCGTLTHVLTLMEILTCDSWHLDPRFSLVLTWSLWHLGPRLGPSVT